MEIVDLEKAIKLLNKQWLEKFDLDKIEKHEVSK